MYVYTPRKHGETFPVGLQDFHYFMHNSPGQAQEKKLYNATVGMDL